jgi:hypothetical protein
MHGLQEATSAFGRRLLRILFVWGREMSAHSTGARLLREPERSMTTTYALERSLTALSMRPSGKRDDYFGQVAP